MTNRFRKEYRPLHEIEKSLVDCIKTEAEAVARYYDQIIDNPHDFPNQRMIAIAMQKLEESVMWATKAITG